MSRSEVSPHHCGNGLDLKKTHKSCRPLVESLQKGAMDEAHQTWVRSTDKATTTPVLGDVQGELPDWLAGDLYRDGPGVLNIGDSWYHHFFDGMAVLHKFSIRNGEATYRSRILDSSSYQRNTSANRIIVDEFGTRGYPDPCKTILQRFMSRFSLPSLDGLTDNCAVNVCFYDDQLYAMTETNMLRRVSPDDLHTVGGKTNLTQYVAVNMATAHPHVDPDGTVYNMGNSYVSTKGPAYNIVKFPPKKILPGGKTLSPFDQASVVASIPCRNRMRPSYYHSYSITDNYFILTEQPLGVSVPKMVACHYRGRPFMKAMEWSPEEKTRFRVVRRSDGHVLTTEYETESFFTFHSINAYEDEGHLVIDLCCFDDGEVVNQLWLETILNPSASFDKAFQAVPRRFVLPLDVKNAPLNTNLVKLPHTKCTATKLKSGAIHCTPRDLCGDCMEMPRINYRLNGKKYRYCYGIISTKGLNTSTLCKIDVESGAITKWSREGYQVSEPIFVERPGATGEEEDDGVVLASLLNQKTEREVRLVVLDAKTFTSLAEVTFQTHGVVTKDLHGLFARAGDKVHRY